MPSRTDALIEQLSAIHSKGFDLSLGRITSLLEKLGNPHLSIPPAIHVAGTNGKGSTLAFCRAILEAGGYSVNMHTSPHLVNWYERYRLGGEFVDDGKLADVIAHVARVNDEKPITIFEIMSAVMFVLFAEHRADYSLVEVGLGGRFDATNVIASPVVTAITPIALDHQAYLGDTIEKIAFEKAGIIKPGIPVVVSEQEDAAREKITEVARSKRAHTFIARQDFDWYRDVTGFVYQDEDGLLDLPMPRLAGEHQLANAATAVAALRSAGIELSESAFRAGMNDVSWPGRFEKLPSGNIAARIGPSADIWIDGGHNPAAGEIIASTLATQRQAAVRRLLMVCGMINTKEPLGYFRPFSKLDAEVITVPVAMSEAGIPPDTLAEIATSAGLTSSSSDTLEDGLDAAGRFLKTCPEAQVLFCGSLYMVGEILARNGTPPK